jgi:hypothetical protein
MARNRHVFGVKTKKRRPALSSSPAIKGSIISLHVEDHKPTLRGGRGLDRSTGRKREPHSSGGFLRSASSSGVVFLVPSDIPVEIPEVRNFSTKDNSEVRSSAWLLKIELNSHIPCTRVKQVESMPGVTA